MLNQAARSNPFALAMEENSASFTGEDLGHGWRRGYCPRINAARGEPRPGLTCPFLPAKLKCPRP
jgi:hypothetical protein